MTNDSLSITDYSTFRQFLENKCGIVLGDNKQYLVKSRLTPLLTKYNIASLSHLLASIAMGRDMTLQHDAINAMTTNETLWFRDTYPFELLQCELFPRFSKSSKPLRVWSAASSSGQEPYSIAMTYLEHQTQTFNRLFCPISITATDISSTMLQQCETGCYDNLALARGLSDVRKRQFFEQFNSKLMRVKPEVRNLVTFKPLNLLDSFLLMGQFDIIFCRNVLIYFSQENKRRIIAKLAACLPSGGILILGASESISSLSTEFVMKKHSIGIYYEKK